MYICIKYLNFTYSKLRYNKRYPLISPYLRKPMLPTVKEAVTIYEGVFFSLRPVLRRPLVGSVSTHFSVSYDQLLLVPLERALHILTC